MKKTETKRTYLRWFTECDIENLVSLMGNSDVMKFSLNGTLNRVQCVKFITHILEQYKRKRYGLFAVFLKSTDEFVGYCGFYDQNIDGCEEIELGYRLLPKFWDQGLATEVSAKVQDIGFKQLGFQRLISIIEAENNASIKVAEKNGFIYENDSIFRNKIPVKIYAYNKPVCNFLGLY